MTSQNREIPLSQLTINIENPRFEMVGTQREAIATMLESQGEKLFKLAEDIVNYGLNPADLVIVLAHQKLDKQYNVLEGNRRVTALKLLSNPELIPEKNKVLLNKFKKLSETFSKNPVSGINCAIFESETDANKWIKLKHTGQNDGVGIVPWDSQQTARFDERVQGKSSYALQILDFLTRQDSFDSILKTNLKSVPSTSLQRLATDPDFRKVVGIGIKDGKVVTKYQPSEVTKSLTKVIKDLLRPDFTVKDIYYKDDRLNYLETFKQQDLPDTSKELAGQWELTSLNPPKASNTAAKQESSSKKESANPTSRNSIIPKSSIIKINEPRINKLYRELKDLDIREVPNAAAITFRVFIELTIDAFLEQKSITGVTVNDKLTKKTDSAIVYLQDNNHLDKHKLKGIKTSISAPHSVMSIDTYHAYVHNRHFHPDQTNLTITWDNLEPFISKIWELI
jgi:ParB-like chromosome segregation protein Spo0J